MQIRKGDYTFDFEAQQYRNREGELVEEVPEGIMDDHSCPSCSSPARLDYCTCYYEWHICEATDCKREFKVC